ncbi:acyltransferase domain-containing protein, partial [Streptomyces spiramenti]|uniref:acyltransferase domain-containing protein n=1 Tax=Streptomyces spiramenti TaxID=2720606 RepID=UPI0030841D13
MLVGHSIGELAAAHVAGVWSLADACAVVAARGRLMQALPEGGAMLAVAAAEADVVAVLTGVDAAGVAAVNGPSSVVVSGTVEAVAGVESVCGERGWRSSRLRVSHAFHSSLMEPMLAEFRQVLESVEHKPARLPLISTLTGESESVFGAEYWVRQVRESVRFADAVTTAEAQGVTRFLEIGPDTTLTALAQQSASSAVLVVPAARHGKESETAEEQWLCSALALLHAHGASPDWRAFFAGADGSRIDLPTHAFQRKPFWLAESSTSADPLSMGLGATDHPLLGASIVLADSDGLLLTGRLSAATQPWLADHRVGGSVVFPGTGFVELAIRAGDQVGCGRLQDLTLHTPLVLPERGAVQIQVIVGTAEEARLRPVSIYSRAEEAVGDAPWIRHATGEVAAVEVREPQPPAGADVWPPENAEAVPLDGMYEELATAGLAYGPVFQGLRSAWRLGDEVYAEVGLAEQHGADADRFGLHPALFDAALHAIGVVGPASGDPALPFAWSGVELHAAGASSARVRVAPAGSGAVSLEIADASGAPIATVASLALRSVSPGELTAARSGAPGTDALFHIDWAQTTLAQAPEMSVGELTDGAAGSGSAAVSLLRAGSADTGADAVRGEVSRVLGVVQSWLAEGAADARLVVLTRGAVALPGEDV